MKGNNLTSSAKAKFKAARPQLQYSDGLDDSDDLDDLWRFKHKSTVSQEARNDWVPFYSERKA